ncbi:MAG: WbqC family protein [Cytophagales bacterium]|nr:WbqC family protein [Cytophagales bacterium]MDW8383597.1 WbqC family protein [Flammeovirgaceae bacterium]
MDENACLISTSYFPSIYYFWLIGKHSTVWIEACENFQKQTFRNRTYILTANGIERLTVPVRRANSKQSIAEVEIDNSVRWYAQHWRALQSAYGKAPFFLYFRDWIHDILFKKHTFLLELNQDILTTCLHQIWKTSITIQFTTNYQKTAIPSLQDYRQAIESVQFFKQIEYPQCFGNKFVPHLSVLDLLFCIGNLPFDKFGGKIE